MAEKVEMADENTAEKESCLTRRSFITGLTALGISTMVAAVAHPVTSETIKIEDGPEALKQLLINDFETGNMELDRVQYLEKMLKLKEISFKTQSDLVIEEHANQLTKEQKVFLDQVRSRRLKPPDMSSLLNYMDRGMKFPCAVTEKVCKELFPDPFYEMFGEEPFCSQLKVLMKEWYQKQVNNKK